MLFRSLLVLGLAMSAMANDEGSRCNNLPSAAQLKAWLKTAALTGTYGKVGGLFDGTRMWAAVVNRDGEFCAAATSTDDPAKVWPGSEAIAKVKAFTANAFSLDDFALSTARLYTFTQPGHSLWSLEGANVFNTRFLLPPDKASEGKNQISGGQIFFGGGLPIYSGGKIIGGLGVSGDTSCADHEIAKRVRDLAKRNPAGGMLADDIQYSSVDGATVFTHPLCIHTYRNGVFIGEESPSTGY